MPADDDRRRAPGAQAERRGRSAGDGLLFSARASLRAVRPLCGKKANCPRRQGREKLVAVNRRILSVSLPLISAQPVAGNGISNDRAVGCSHFQTNNAKSNADEFRSLIGHDLVTHS